MPRKKITTIPISDLSCQSTIIAELKKLKEFSDVDFSTITISAKQYVAPTVRHENLRKAIGYIERHISMNCKTEMDYYTSRSGLARITKLTRPTINRWYRDEVITHDLGISKPSSGYILFHLTDLLKQLREIKNVQK